MILTLYSLLLKTLDEVAAWLRDPLLLAIRLYWGWQFFLTGKGKLLNLDATAEFFATLGLPAAKFQALLAGGTECLGGLLLLAGCFSRLVTIPLVVTMLVAYGTAHWDVVLSAWHDSDSFVTAPPFLFLLASLIVFVFGPGRWSADNWAKSRRTTMEVA